ncbi:MAG: hypothetical protein QUS13_00625 [Smithella sp.]|nr:hypothetical protein [Smithella sp.]
MNKRASTLFLAMIIISLCASSAHALGIGAYGYVGAGKARAAGWFLIPILSSVLEPDISAGGGLVIDSNCAGDRLFNYRLAIGGARTFPLKSDEKTAHITRLHAANIFGFGVVHREGFRFWVGPQLGFNTLYYRDQKELADQITTVGGSVTYNPFMGKQTKYSLFGASLGLALGMNFNLPRDMTLSLEGGYRYALYYGVKYQKAYLPFSGGYIPLAINGWSLWSGDDGYVSIAVLYRVNDAFTGGTAEGGK